jgi:type IV secretory pathway VirB2 component (pilin)
MNQDEIDRALRAHFQRHAPSADFDRVLLARLARASAAAAQFDRVQALRRAAHSREQALARLRHDARESWFGAVGTVLAVLGIIIGTAPAWQGALTWRELPNVLAVLGLTVGLAFAARVLLPRLRQALR